MPYVPTEEVESSNIERIGYLRTQQILRIVFKGGRTYDYPMVTERDFRDLMEADSKGSFFNRRIKPLYAHRTPREVELVEPCCEHGGSDLCTKECFPCNEFCCPGAPSGASQEEIAAAIKDGLAFGAADHSAAPSPVQDESPEAETRIVQMLGDTDMVYLSGGVMTPGPVEKSAATDEKEEEETNGSSD